MSASSRHTAGLLRELADMIEEGTAVTVEFTDTLNISAIIGSKTNTRTLTIKALVRAQETM